MADSLKVLGQADLDATTLTDIYTVPSGASASISSVVVCNRSSSADSFRLAVAPAGASDDPAHYLYYDVPIPANDTFVCTIGITLGATDVIRAYGGTTDISVSVFGVEVA